MTLVIYYDVFDLEFFVFEARVLQAALLLFIICFREIFSLVIFILPRHFFLFLLILDIQFFPLVSFIVADCIVVAHI